MEKILFDKAHSVAFTGHRFISMDKQNELKQSLQAAIIEHYKSGHVLPGGLEKARSIAMHGGYDFIEVYVDCCRAISSNGSVSVISC